MKDNKHSSIVGLRDLRERLPEFIEDIEQGKSFVVVKHSRPVFRISPIDDEDLWEPVVDFTTIEKGGINIEDILSRL